MEHELVSAPLLDPLHFEPRGSTQEEVLAEHAQERGKTFSNPISMVNGHPTMGSIGEGSPLTAVLLTAQEDPPEQTVRVLKNGEVMFETGAGMPSPVLPLQGLWTYDGHWALEILLAEEPVWAGQIFIDGELVNTGAGVEEAFGFQLLAGSPFYFYRRDGRIGYVYGGREVDLDYTEIPHYLCCSGTVLNPIQAENMVAFFARNSDGGWVYAELGRFNP